MDQTNPSCVLFSLQTLEQPQRAEEVILVEQINYTGQTNIYYPCVDRSNHVHFGIIRGSWSCVLRFCWNPRRWVLDTIQDLEFALINGTNLGMRDSRYCAIFEFNYDGK